MTRGQRWSSGAAIGLATGAAALGAAELVSGVHRSSASPLTSVGDRVVDAVPQWLKAFAIETFGTNDKAVLLGTLVVLIAVFAALLGVLSQRHLGLATAGVGLFGLVGGVSAAAGPGGLPAAVPSLVGAVAGAVAIRFLARRGTVNRLPAELAQTPEPADSGPTPSRRGVLRAAGAVGAMGMAGATVGRLLRSRFDAALERAKVVLPRAARRLEPLDLAAVQAPVTGATPFVTPNANFYRIDTALAVPQVDLDGWRLRVTGMVERDIELTFDELLARELVEADVTLTCVSNEVGGQLAGNARWLGVPLRSLLEEAGVDPAADQVVGRSVDGYTCGFPTSALDDDRTALVAVGMNGEPLPVNHGFPARLVVAGLYGYVSATKWLTEIDLTRFDRFEQYWVPRGYAPRAPIKTFSRIDTPAPLARIASGPTPIAGVAWAQPRGIAAVEVRIDGGEWLQSELRAAPNNETWRQWVLRWEATPGRHEITCRATDGSGEVQTAERIGPFPDGATGRHSIVVLVD